MVWTQTGSDASDAEHLLIMPKVPFPFAVHSRAKSFLQNIFYPENVFVAQNFSLSIFAFTGLASWKSAGPEKERRLHTNLRLLTMAIQCFGYMASLLITLQRQENFISFFFTNDVTEVTSLIELIIAMFAVTVVYSKCYLRRRYYRNFFLLLHEVDQKFEQLGVGVAEKVSDFRTTVWFSVKLMMSTFVLLGLYVMASYAIQWGKEQMAHMYAWVAYFWPQLMFAMAVNLAVTMMWQVGERFERLNRVSIL